MAVFLTELILYSNTTLFGPFSNAFTLFPYPALCFSIAMCPEGMTFICHPILYLYPLPHDFVISQSDTGFGYMTYFGQWNFSRYDAGRHLKKPALISTWLLLFCNFCEYMLQDKVCGTGLNYPRHSQPQHSRSAHSWLIFGYMNKFSGE